MMTSPRHDIFVTHQGVAPISLFFLTIHEYNFTKV